MNSAQTTPLKFNTPRALIFFVVLYLGATLYPALFKLSPTQDEPSHVRSGLTMLTGSGYVDSQHSWWTQLDALHPPSDMLAGLAALITGQSPDFRHKIHPSFNAVRAGRCVNIVLGLAVLLVGYSWARQVWGEKAGVWAVIGIMAQPLFLSHAELVSSDLTMALGGLLAAYTLWHRWLHSTEWLKAAPGKFLIGILTISAALLFGILCKVSNLYFIAVHVLLAIWFARGVRRSPSHNQLVIRAAVSVLLSTALTLVAAAAIWDAISPPRPPVNLFGHAVQLPFGKAFLFSAHTAGSIQNAIALPVYFLHLRPPSWKFYALALVLKTPWPLLIVWGMLPWLIWRRWHVLLPQQRTWLLYIFVLSLGMAMLFSTRGIYLGLRHLLLPLVLMGVLLGGWGKLFSPEQRFFCWFPRLILILLFLLNIRAWPYQLSFFNLKLRLSKSSLLPLVDSDSDWGQGLIALREWQERHPHTPLWLAYFGNARPEDFGIRYRGMLSPYSYCQLDPEFEKGRDPKQLHGYVAISATHLAGTVMHEAKESPDYYAAWRELKPRKLIGGSIYLYDRRKR